MMTKKANMFRRFVAFVLAFVILLPNVVFADNQEVIYLTEDSLDDVVYSENLFYLATSAAQVDENSTAHYLLKIGRGGTAEDKATVTVNMSDVTAKYGKDYKIKLYEGSLFEQKADATDNPSLVELMSGDYTEYEVGDPDTLQQAIDDEVISASALYEGAATAMNDAIAANAEANGSDISAYEAERDDLDATPVEEILGSTEEAVVEESVESETESASGTTLNSLVAARKAYTGMDSDRTPMTSSSDLLTQLYDLNKYQDIANVINESFVSATMDVTFDVGESVKYIEIIPINNNESDGSRLFTVKLDVPSDGYTNSIYSTSNITIVDDEPEVLSKFTFDSAQYTAEDNKVSVTIKRNEGINDIASVMLKSRSATALSGRDFQPVNAEVVFPFGVSERTVDVIVDDTYITDTADFYLYLEEYTSAEAGEITETRVDIPPSSGDSDTDTTTTTTTVTTGGDSSISAYAYDEDGSTTINGPKEVTAYPRKYFSILDINSKRTATENGSGFSGSNSASGSNWHMKLTSRTWCNAYFRWANKNDAIVNRYDINGVRISTSASSSKPCHADAYVGYRKDGQNTKVLTLDGKRWGWKANEVYFNTDYSNDCYISENDPGGHDMDVYFTDIAPIKRQFTVKLKEAAPLTFQDENGNQVADSTATKAVFTGLKPAGYGVNTADTSSVLIRVSGETINVKANNSNKSSLTGLQLVAPNGNTKVIVKNSKLSSNDELSFTFNNSFILDNLSYITFSADNNGGKKGEFTVQPIFEKIPKTVTLMKNTNVSASELATYNSAATFVINGKQYTIPSGKDSLDINNFYVGDVINIVAGSTHQLYTPSAIGYRLKMSSTSNYSNNYSLAYNNDHTIKLGADNNDAMRAVGIQLFPILKTDKASICIRVKKSDIDEGRFDTTYGIFNVGAANKAQVVENGVAYTEFYLNKGEVSVNTRYTLNARANGDYALVWQSATSSDKKYTGNTFYYVAESDYSDGNVVYLSAERYNTYMFDFNGEAKYLNYNLETARTSEEGFMPASGVAVDFGGSGATTDNDGKYETSPVRLVKGLWVTYSVSNMGDTYYDEVKVSTSGKNVKSGNKSYNVVNIVNKLNESGVWEQKTESTASTGKVYSYNIGQLKMNAYNIAGRCSVRRTLFEKAVNDVYWPTYGGIDIDGGTYRFNAVISESEENTYEISGINSKTGENETDTKTETVKGVRFLVYDSKTYKLKATYNAEKTSSTSYDSTWSAKDLIFSKENDAQYAKGDLIFVQVISDMDPTGQGMSTEYAPLNTGNTFIMTDEYAPEYQPQLFDIPLGGSYTSLPMLDSIAMGFDFPFVSVSLETMSDGTYRVSVGASLTDIYDKAKGTNIGSKNADNGQDYSEIFQLKHPFKSFKEMAQAEWADTFKNAGELYNGTTSQLGAAAFTFNVTVGMYFEFGKLTVESTSDTASKFVLTGAGGYIGAGITFQKAWYVLIGGIVPGYLGITADGSLQVNLGATRNTTKIITTKDMTEGTVELDSGLDFNTDLQAAASVAMYAGVGLCGTLGVRVGGEADFIFVWYPMAKKTWRLNDEPVDISSDATAVKTIGTSTTFKLGGWVDVVMFTIPIMYSFDPINTGFAKQSADGKIVKRTTTVSNDTSTQTSEFDIPNGWYYIRSQNTQQYLQIPSSSHISGETALGVGVKSNSKLYNQKWFVYTGSDGKTTVTAYDSASGNRQYVYSKNTKDDKVYKSAAIADSNVTELYDFVFKKVADSAYIAIPAKANTSTPKMLTSTDRNGNVTTKSVSYKNVSDPQLWLFEPVDDTVAPGSYNIKNVGTSKMATRGANNWGIVTSDYIDTTVEKNAKDKSQSWTVSYDKDGFAMIKNDDNNKYFNICGGGHANGATMITYSTKVTSWNEKFNIKADNYGHYTISSGSYSDMLITDDSKNNVILHQTYGTAADYNRQLWFFTPLTSKATKVSTYAVEEDEDTATNEMLLGNLTQINEGDLTSTPINTYAEETESVTPTITSGLAEPRLRERTSGDSVWLGESNKSELEAMSGFSQTYESVLVDNSYERPDSQIMDMGNGKYILVFIDTDQSRGELERNALKYSIYDGKNWTKPETIQNDNTADFSPSIADAGDSIAVAWTSSDPRTEKTGDAIQYLTTTEIYTTLINKTTGKVGEITQLTSDTFYDSDPTVLYDATTGNMACYYLKSEVSDSFQDSVSPVTNGCILTYMLYDSEMGKWLFDYYYPEEEEEFTEAEEKELIEVWHGQRFLPSALDDVEFVVNQDPLISDFTAISYNGLAVYAYTVDKDNDSATDSDRDLFVQVMDMVNHKDYKPIRITNDDVADALPQFVRNNAAESPETYLYWFVNGDTITSINVSDLVREGINADGTIKDDYELIEDSVQVKLTTTDDAKPAMSSYKAYKDKQDNTYIVWSDVDRSTGKQEIFATARIDDGTTSNWANAYQLTHSGKYNDEPAFVVDSNGNLILVNDRYEMTINEGDAENPATISENQLVVTHFEPCGELYAQNIRFDNDYPVEGTTDTITYEINNSGLTTAKGYTINVYEENGTSKKLIDTKNVSDSLVPDGTVVYTTDWTVPSNLDGMKIVIEVQEADMPNLGITESEEFKVAPYYSIDSFSTEQTNDGFIGYVQVTNVGNKAADGKDVLKVMYLREMATAEQLGITDTEFASAPISLAVGESTELELPLSNLSGDNFEAFGYVPAIAYAVDSEDEVASDYRESRICITSPADIKINGGVESISLNSADVVDLNVEFAPADRFTSAEVSYVSDNTSVVIVSDGKLIPIGNGTTTVRAYIAPYGVYKEIEVVVTGFADTVEAATEETTAKSSGGGGSSSNKAVTSAEESTEGTTASVTEAVDTNNDAFTDIFDHWGRDIINEVAEKNIVFGYEDNTFRPDNSITRAEFLTILYKSGLADTTTADAEVSFSDVSGDEWYADYIKWGVANDLIVGYEDNTFRGDNVISRQEMAVVISKFVDLAGIEYNAGEAVDFADSEDIADWAKSYVDKVSAYGIATGDNNNCYLPTKDLTRAETAVIINRIVK